MVNARNTSAKILLASILFSQLIPLASASVENDVKGKTLKQKADIKATAIMMELSDGSFSKGGYTVNITEVHKLTGGVEVYASADRGGDPVGFGNDGTVEIERFRFWNPPVLVDDPTGTITRTWEANGKNYTRSLREDPLEAIRSALSNAIDRVGTDGKNIVKGKVGSTVDVFYPSMDGRVGIQGGAGQSYATVHDATAGAEVSTNGTLIDAWNSKEGTSYFIYRTAILFDTSALTSGVDVSAATLSIYGQQKSDGESDSVAIVTSSPASTSTLTTDDYDQFGTTQQATAIAISSFSTAAYNDFAFNATGISNVNRTGISQFGMRLLKDVNNSAPTSGTSTYAYIYASDQTGTDKDPTLTVTHSPIASSSSSAASSVASSVASSSAASAYTGSLVITHTACNAYILNESGFTVGCDQWDTSIEVPAVSAFRQQAATIIFSALVLFFRWVFLLVVLYLILRWFFRIITRYRSRRR